jgi:SAM-dependent methyltransferase
MLPGAMAFEELKQRHSVVWGHGPYQNITDTLTDIHERVVERLDPQPGETWLDLATGTGAVAELAARRGARVTGLDLAPALIETAVERAREQQLEIDYVVGDCEALELEDASFDLLSSTCGQMFAPDHAATARELTRVVRPGGRIALANWRPDAGVHDLFKLMAPFQPAPPPAGAGMPFDWGREEHVRDLLGDGFELTFEEHVSTVRLESGEAYWQLFATSYGPTRVLAESLDDERREELRRSWADFFDANHRDDEGGIAHPRPYLLVLGTRR